MHKLKQIAAIALTGLALAAGPADHAGRVLMQKSKLIAVIALTGVGLAAGATAAGAQALPGGFVFLRDIDPTILQDIRYAGVEQFRRPQAFGLRRRRMRGEAERRPGAESRPAGTGEAKTVAEDVRLLPAGAGLARHGGVGAERQGDAGRAALQPGASPRPTCSGWAISPSVRSIPPAPRSISPWSISPPTIPPRSIPPRPMPTAPRPKAPARRKAASTWAPAMTVPTSSRTPRRGPSRRSSGAGGTCWWPRWRSRVLSTIRRSGGTFRCRAPAGRRMIFRSGGAPQIRSHCRARRCKRAAPSFQLVREPHRSSATARMRLIGREE